MGYGNQGERHGTPVGFVRGDVTRFGGTKPKPYHRGAGTRREHKDRWIFGGLRHLDSFQPSSISSSFCFLSSREYTEFRGLFAPGESNVGVLTCRDGR